jgi:hypothetical protein
VWRAGESLNRRKGGRENLLGFFLGFLLNSSFRIISLPPFLPSSL